MAENPKKPETPLQEGIQMPSTYINEDWIKYYFFHYCLFNPVAGQHTTVSDEIVEICLEFMRPIFFPYNNQFVTYLHTVQIVEETEKRKVDPNCLNEKANNARRAIAQNTTSAFAAVKPYLEEQKVPFRRLKWWHIPDGKNTYRVDFCNDTSEKQLPKMRIWWGRFDIFSILYFRTGEWKFNGNFCSEGLAFLVGQLAPPDGRYFVYRCYTPDFMDGWALPSSLWRFQVGYNLNDLLGKFSARDEERFWNNEANGYPLSYDESYIEMKNLLTDKRLAWANDKIWFPFDPEIDNPHKPRSIKDAWEAYKVAWFSTKKTMRVECIMKVTNQAWMKDLYDECSKKEPKWTTADIPENYATIMEAIGNVHSGEHLPPRLGPVKLFAKPSWCYQ